MNRVTAVVVTYNRWELLGECVDALMHQTHPLSHIVLIDNASTDERYRSGEWPWQTGLQEATESTPVKGFETEMQVTPILRIERLPQNIGGAGGFARGVELAREYQDEWVLILDDDCILNPDYVEKLLEYYKVHSDIGALCGTVYTEGQLMTDHRGYLTSLAKEKMPGASTTTPTKERLPKTYSPLDTWHEHPVEAYNSEALACSVVSFCGLMVSRKVVDQIGLPRKEYFIRCDDIEYTLRISKIASIINVCAAKLNHKVKVTSGTEKFDWKVYYDIRNGLDMTARHGLLLVNVKFKIKYLVKAIIFAIKNKTLASLRLYIDALRDSKQEKLGLNEKYF